MICEICLDDVYWMHEDICPCRCHWTGDDIAKHDADEKNKRKQEDGI